MKLMFVYCILILIICVLNIRFDDISKLILSNNSTKYDSLMNYDKTKIYDSITKDKLHLELQK